LSELCRDMKCLMISPGGGSGIRTHDTVSRIHAFQACALSHSAIPPRACGSIKYSPSRPSDKAAHVPSRGTGTAFPCARHYLNDSGMTSPDDDYLIRPDPLDPRLTERVNGVDQTGQAIETRVTVERALTIFLNSQEIVTAMTINDYPEYLALGYLLNQHMLLP